MESIASSFFPGAVECSDTFKLMLHAHFGLKGAVFGQCTCEVEHNPRQTLRSAYLEPMHKMMRLLEHFVEFVKNLRSALPCHFIADRNGLQAKARFRVSQQV